MTTEHVKSFSALFWALVALVCCGPSATAHAAARAAARTAADDAAAQAAADDGAAKAVAGESAGKAVAGEAAASPNVRLRGSLQNSRLRFEREKKGCVAFIGGSITEMDGYRPMVCRILEKRFPATEFTFIDAGIASTCSTTGAFRLASDVLSQGPVDLFFIEFAVNDDQDAGHTRRECIRGMEGIIRQARRHNPCIDVVITYFVNPGMVETIRAGGTPVSIGAHEEVARHYDISTIHLANEVSQRIAAGKLTWEQFGGTHPAPYGNAMCAGMIDELLSRAWKEPLAADAERQAHPMPAAPLDANHYGDGRFVDPRGARAAGAWKWHTPDWKSLPGRCRERFAGLALLCAEEPGEELTLAFEGRAVGAYVLAGPDAGMVEAGIDGGQFKPVDLFHRFSRGLHYPRTIVFDADLEPGKHVVTLRIAAEKNDASSGHAVRILQFTAN
jgi:lysophospholipase L1-like esterase